MKNRKKEFNAKTKSFANKVCSVLNTIIDKQQSEMAQRGLKDRKSFLTGNEMSTKKYNQLRRKVVNKLTRQEISLNILNNFNQ